MNETINQLKEIAKKQDGRGSKTINNLINRIIFFENAGDKEKLSNCKAEANLWGAK